MHRDFRTFEQRKHARQFALHGAKFVLNLPAVEISAVVLKNKFEVHIRNGFAARCAVRLSLTASQPSLPSMFRGCASKHRQYSFRKALIGKAKPFRTSNGEALGLCLNFAYARSAAGFDDGFAAL